jgi:hypothetical protein
MNSTALIHPTQATELPSFGDEVSEFLPYVAAIAVLAPISLLSLVLWVPFLLVLALVLAPFLLVAVLGLVATILATPFLLVRELHQRRVGRSR